MEYANHNNKIMFANTLRGIAALSVMLMHYFSIFWGNPAVIAQLTNAPALNFSHPTVAWYVIILQQLDIWLHLNFSAFGVALFFLISGFVIPFSLQKTQPLGFFLNRFFRIYPTYIAGFTFTLLALYISGKYFGRPFAYSVSAVFIHYIPGLRDIFHLPSIDGIVWTLEVELKFYVCCALFFGWIKAGEIKILFFPAFLWLMVILVGNYVHVIAMAHYVAKLQEVSAFLIYMWIGVSFNFYVRKTIRAESLIFFVVMCFILFACVWQKCRPNQIYQVWSYGIALMVFVAGLAYPEFFKANRYTTFFANMSYPLYVVHAVVGYVAIRILLELGWSPEAAVLITILGVFGLAFFLHRWVEVPTQKLGRKMAQQFARFSLSAAMREKNEFLSDA